MANLAMGLFQFPLWKLGIIKHPLAHYAASMFMNPLTIHHTITGSVVGSVANYIYGAFWGIIFVYSVYFTGKRYLIIKGFIFGAFLWLISFGGLRSLPIVKLREVMPENVLYYLFFHLVFGLALGLLVKEFGERVLEER